MLSHPDQRRRAAWPGRPVPVGGECSWAAPQRNSSGFDVVDDAGGAVSSKLHHLHQRTCSLDSSVSLDSVLRPAASAVSSIERNDSMTSSVGAALSSGDSRGSSSGHSSSSCSGDDDDRGSRDFKNDASAAAAAAALPRPAPSKSSLRFVPGADWPPPKTAAATNNDSLPQQGRPPLLPLPSSAPLPPALAPAPVAPGIVSAAAVAAASAASALPPSAAAPPRPSRPLSPPHSPERLRAPRPRRNSSSSAASSSSSGGQSHRRVSAARRLCPAFEAAAAKEEEEEESSSEEEGEEGEAAAPLSSPDEEQGGVAAAALSPSARGNAADVEQGGSSAFSPSALLRSLLSQPLLLRTPDQHPVVEARPRPLVSLASALAPPPPPRPVAVAAEEQREGGRLPASPSSPSPAPPPPPPRLSEAFVGVVVASLARQLARVHASGRVHRRVCASAVLVSEGAWREEDENGDGRRQRRAPLLLPAVASSVVVRLAPAAPGGRLPGDGRPLLGPKVAAVAPGAGGGPGPAVASGGGGGTPHPAPEIARSRDAGGGEAGPRGRRGSRSSQRGGVRHAPPSDVWSLGVLAAGLLSGNPRGAAPPFALPGALLAAASTTTGGGDDGGGGPALAAGEAAAGRSGGPRSSADADELQRWVDRSLSRSLDAAGLAAGHPARAALASMLRVDPAQRPTAGALVLAPPRPAAAGPGAGGGEDGRAARRWLRGALDAAGVELAGEDEVVTFRDAAPAAEEEEEENAAPLAPTSSAARIPRSLFPRSSSPSCCALRSAAAAVPCCPPPPPWTAASCCESELDAETLDALRKLWLTASPSSSSSSRTRAAALPSSSAPAQRSWASAVGAALDSSVAPLLLPSSSEPGAAPASSGALSWLSRFLPRGGAAASSAREDGDPRRRASRDGPSPSPSSPGGVFAVRA